MRDLNLIELYKIKKRLINENMSDDILMQEVLESIKYHEDMILEDSDKTKVDIKSNIKDYYTFIVENYKNNNGVK